MHLPVLYAVSNGVAEIEINRRERRNALDDNTYTMLSEAFADAENDPEVRVVLMRGQSDMFTAGKDLKSESVPHEGYRPVLTFMDTVNALTKPLIAAVAGSAMGIGTTLLYHCDVVYAASNAKFGMPFTKLGVSPEFGSSRLAPLTAGYRLAAEAMLFADTFDADHALRMGLVNRVLPPERLFAYARERAETLAKMPGASVAKTKALIKHDAFAGMNALFRSELYEFETLLDSSESKALIARFGKKH
ncbi:enoyl-CoA hydratase/isomerase family protein [Burkholderia sp. FL-7-2-10-S1-D7]|uniref:enoyl-CoA hydratase/isomerase family protein n=1 Tax=Burkholderia sp. FL-7-2-10-S1-D7 TaxID=1637866 RepID=UPI000A9E0ABC|nr:enoyl-CoA hydratase-related protein [Burkholderia sp. FL-7-2-10-S1-D7]